MIGAPSALEAAMAGNVREFTDANFESEVLGSELPVLVDFTATWCGPCKKVAPIVEELADRYAGKVRFGKLDIDASQRSAVTWRVRSVPTLLLFKGGKEAGRIVGAVPARKIEDLLK